MDYWMVRCQGLNQRLQQCHFDRVKDERREISIVDKGLDDALLDIRGLKSEVRKLDSQIAFHFLHFD